MPATDEQFEALLSWLNPDSERAQQEYVRFHGRLKSFFKYETLAGPDADKLADDTFDLVAKKLVSSQLSNAGTDILDMPGLCARLCVEGARDSRGPSRRVMELLPEPAGEIVRAVATISDFQQRGSPLLCAGDLKDLKRFARRLLDEGSALSTCLREQLKEDVLERLRNFDGSQAAAGPTEKSLLGELNRLITERRLLEVEEFARLAPESYPKGLTGPRHEDDMRVNRVLLEEAFPDEIAKSERHAARLSKALNGLLGRSDFFRPSDFETVAHGGEAERLVAVGTDELSQGEVEKLNRLLLEAAFPREIAKRLIDRQYEDRWAYFEKTARNVYLKHAMKRKERTTILEPTSPADAERPGGAILKFLAEKFREEMEEFVSHIDSSREYACLQDCCRKHGSECDLVMRYYSAASGAARQDEAGAAVEGKNKLIRKRIAEDEGVSRNVIKTRAHRAKVKLRACVTDCLEKEAEGRRHFPAKGD